MRQVGLGCVGSLLAAACSTVHAAPHRRDRALLSAEVFTVDEFELVDLSGFPADATGVVGVGGTPQGAGLGIEVEAGSPPVWR